MNITDTFYIQNNGVTIKIEVEGWSAIGEDAQRPRWKGNFESEAQAFAAAIEEVREALDSIDDDDVAQFGTVGMSFGDLYIEGGDSPTLTVKERDSEEPIGELTQEELRELL